MSLDQVVSAVTAEVPERQSTDRVALRREVESVLLAGSALPEGTPGALRLRAHRLIRGGWKFVRCVDLGCGRIYPMGEPTCACGRLTAPLFLCRSCGADYLRLEGDPETGQMRPYGEQASSEEWMLYDVGRQEADIGVEDGAEDGDGEAPQRPRRSRARVEQVRGQPVHQGAFDPRALTFSRTAGDFPMQVRLVRGRTRCLCCGGAAGTRNMITHVSLGTSAASRDFVGSALNLILS